MVDPDTEWGNAMKKLLLTVALCILASPGAEAKTYNINLNGFCTTFTLSVAKWQVSGTRSGCGYDVTDGGVFGTIGGGKWIASNDSNYTYNGDTGQFTWIFTKPHRSHGVWGEYYSDGTDLVCVASGTYTITTAAAGKYRSGPDVTLRP